jgi:hypothetical protein
LTQSAAPVAVTKGGSIVDYCARFSTLNARYEEFLFAQVCEEANGMRLSVLSALARMNVDPWEEATRLAAMPRAIAEKTLLSILDAVSGRSWKSPEAAGNCCAAGSAAPAAGRGCNRCGDDNRARLGAILRAKFAARLRATQKLLVGVVGLCAGDVVHDAAPSARAGERSCGHNAVRRDNAIE